MEKSCRCQGLASRIDAVERRLATYRRLVVVALAAVVSTAAIHSRPREQVGPVEATEFRLLDANGEQVATLSSGASGLADPQLMLMSRDGWALSLTPRLITQMRTPITVGDIEFNMMVSADSMASGLRLGGPSGGLRFVAMDGAPALELVDADGQVRAILGQAHLTRAATGSTEITAPSSLALFDQDGSTVWRAPPDR